MTASPLTGELQKLSSQVQTSPGGWRVSEHYWGMEGDNIPRGWTVIPLPSPVLTLKTALAVTVETVSVGHTQGARGIPGVATGPTPCLLHGITLHYVGGHIAEHSFGTSLTYFV